MSSFTLKCGQLYLARNSRYVEVHSATSSFLWLLVGGIIVLVNLVVVIGQHGYTFEFPDTHQKHGKHVMS